MDSQSSKVKILKKTGKYMLFTMAALIVIVMVANWIYIKSGSNEWELKLEKNGVKVYALKTPGSGITQYKGIVQGDYSLNQLVAGLVGDNTFETCKEWIPNCMAAQTVEPWNNDTRSETSMWTFRLPWPFEPREFINRSRVTQDKMTKTVRVDFYGAPDKLPLNEGRIRAKSIHNYLTYTPLEDGMVEVVNVQHYSMGGWFPDYLLNLNRVDMMYTGLHDLYPKVLNKERYKQARYDFIEEKDAKKEIAVRK